VPAPFTMVVELGKAREFARAVDHTEPIEAGSPVPVTFLQTMAFWSGPESAVWPADRDFSRVLHGSQEFTFHGGPIRIGEELVCQARIDRTYTKEGKRGGTMTFSDLVTDFHSPDGTLRAEVKTVSIETEAAPA
jgi:hypothetical protein